MEAPDALVHDTPNEDSIHAHGRIALQKRSLVFFASHDRLSTSHLHPQLLVIIPLASPYETKYSFVVPTLMDIPAVFLLKGVENRIEI